LVSPAVPAARRPTIAVQPDGSFVVGWTSLNGPVLARARRYDSLGQPVGDTFTLNAGPGGIDPDVVALGGGEYLAVWEGADQIDVKGIYARHIDAAGTLGTAFRVNQKTDGFQLIPAVAVDASGD